MNRLNRERAAAILAEAAFFGDKSAARRHGITTRTIQNYRARLDEDDDLSVLFAIKKQRLEDGWAEELSGAIRASIRFLAEAAAEAKRTDPDVIHAVAGALKILADVAMTKRVLDARLTERGEPERAPDRQVVADEALAGDERGEQR